MRQRLLKFACAAFLLCMLPDIAYVAIKRVTLYEQDHEQLTDETLGNVWKSSEYYPTTLVTGDAIYGNYASCTKVQSGKTENTLAYLPFYETGSDIYKYEDKVINKYNVDFDALVYSYVRAQSIALYSEGANVNGGDFIANNKTTGENPTSTNYLFFANNKAWKSSTVKVNESSTVTYDYSKDVWYHYSFVITKVSETSVKVDYTITNKATGDVILKNSAEFDDGRSYKCQGLHIGKQRYDGIYSVDNVKVTADVEVEGNVANEPVIENTGINADGREYTITFVEGETLHYILPGDEEKIVTEGTSVVVTAKQEGTIVAYTTRGEAASDKAEASVVLTPVLLNAPTAVLTGMSEGYSKTYTISIDNSSVEFAPTAAMSYVVKYADGTQTAAGDIKNGGTVELTMAGTLVVTAAAPGYTSSTVTVENMVAYKKVKEFALDKMTADDFGNENIWTAGTGWPRENWNQIGMTNEVVKYEVKNTKDADSKLVSVDGDVTKAISGLTLFTNRIPTVYIGFGLLASYEVVGGNNYGNIMISGAEQDQIAVYSGWKDYGRNEFLTVKDATSTFGLYRFDHILRNITVYAPATQTVTIGDALHTTFSSANALDFTGVAGVKAYVASSVLGSTVNMTQVEGAVPAGIGLILKTDAAGSFQIPVVAEAEPLAAVNMLVGTIEQTEIKASEEGSFNYVFGRRA